jgi:hypothetical protein
MPFGRLKPGRPTVQSVKDAGELAARWRTPPNFRIDANLTPLTLTFPTAQAVLDELRKDPETRITVLGDDKPAVRTARSLAIRTAPIDEVITWPFRLVHFNLSRFYGGLLHDFQEKIMIPWRTFLAAQGFTWHRCSPALFISSQRCGSTYHADNSHGLVWQVEGIKTFHSFAKPDPLVPASVAIHTDISSETPPAHAASDRLSFRMQPGDMLWSHVLTPHWVNSETALSMSINISHGGLCHQGSYAEREQALRRHWDDHPEQPWMHDLRNTRY